MPIEDSDQVVYRWFVINRTAPNGLPWIIRRHPHPQFVVVSIVCSCCCCWLRQTHGFEDTHTGRYGRFWRTQYYVDWFLDFGFWRKRNIVFCLYFHCIVWVSVLSLRKRQEFVVVCWVLQSKIRKHVENIHKYYKVTKTLLCVLS